MYKLIITIVDEEQKDVSIEDLEKLSFTIEHFDLIDFIKTVKKARTIYDFESIMKVGKYQGIITDKILEIFDIGNN